MSKVYVAIGFEESRLDMAIAEVSDIKRTRIMLRSQSLKEPLVCRQTGKLRTQPSELTSLGNSLEAFITRGPVQVLIGIPDNLCRMRIVRGDENRPEAADSFKARDPRSKDERVFSTHHPQSSGDTTEGLLVTAPRLDIMRYMEPFDREPYELSVMTPASICRYNYLVGRLPELSEKSHVLVHLSESSCDIAVWSEGLPRYNERLSRDDCSWPCVAQWLDRVEAVASRTGRGSKMLLRGPAEMVTMAEQKLVNARVFNEQTVAFYDRGCSLEGDASLPSSGNFDVALGLLAYEARGSIVGD